MPVVARVLVIDDQPDILRSFVQVLAQQPSPEAVALDRLAEAVLDQPETTSEPGPTFSVVTAQGGAEGLRCHAEAHATGASFSVAFVDMRMPGMDGLTTIERLWATDPTLQIVITTAYSDHSWRGVCARLGYRPNLLILRKPFDPIEVLQLATAGAVAKSRSVAEAHRQRDEALATLGRSAGGIAHDLNNILAGVIGFATSARSHRSISPEVLSQLDHVLSTAEQGRRLTARLFAMVRGQAPILAPLQLDRLISESLPLLYQLLGPGVSLLPTLGAGSARILGEPGILQQVILNLIINARNAMPSGGRIILVTSQIGAGQIRLTVIDHGPGIETEQIRRLNQPFKTSTSGGTGLGLMVVRDAMIDMHGEVFVDSRKGQGTTISLTFPEVP